MNLLHVFLHLFAGLGALSALRAREDGADTPELTIKVAKWAPGEAPEWRPLHKGRGEFQSLIQSDVNGFQTVESQGGVVLPIVFIALALLVCISCFCVVMLNSDQDDGKSTTLPLPSIQKQATSPVQQLQVLQTSPIMIPQSTPMQRSPQPPPQLQPGSRQMAPPLPSAPPTDGYQVLQSGDAASASADVEQGTLPPQPPVPKPSVSSTALIVRSAEGVILQSDYKVSPHPEQHLVNFRSLKGANAVVRARIDELSGSSQIMVETASGIPLALIDTKSAVYPQNYDAPPRDTRRANIHRVAGKSFSLLGSPCASVLSVSRQTFVVLSSSGGEVPQDNRGLLAQMGRALSHGFASHPDVLLTVQCDEAGYVTEMRDGSGGVVVRQEAGGNRGGDGRSNIWVSQGADITLIVCIVLAVGKLQ